ncbi:MAG: thymidine phosphorylase [Nanoarchaeota archaeon]
MKLKVKNLNWLAGRPVAILNEITAKKLNVFVDDRVAISNSKFDSKKVYAVVDIFSKVVKKNEIGLSHELSSILGIKSNSLVEISSSEMSKATFLIKKKMDGKSLTKEEISFLISEIVQNNLTEAEIAYFTAAEKLNGMSKKEVIGLVEAMVQTGAKISFKGKLIADKHCIGGIAGNRTTPIIISICVAAGLTMPKTSSRAITSASGTADVIETIANVEIDVKRLKEVVNETGGCLIWGGSLGLAPSDDKIISVERLLNLDIEPQMIASIMSKKISVGSKYLIIDIPYGKGAKVSSIKEAKKLGNKFKDVARQFKINFKAVYTDGSQPIGNGYGPVLEMFDVLKVLKNCSDAPRDLRDKALFLSSELLELCGIKNSKKIALEILSSGKAYLKFKEIINAQNNKQDFEKRVSRLKLAKFQKTIYAKKSGKIVSIGNKETNSLCRVLGTPESISAGVYLYKHVGNVKKGEPILTLYSESKSKIKDGLDYMKHFNPIKIK